MAIWRNREKSGACQNDELNGAWWWSNMEQISRENSALVFHFPLSVFPRIEEDLSRLRRRLSTGGAGGRRPQTTDEIGGEGGGPHAKLYYRVISNIHIFIIGNNEGKSRAPIAGRKVAYYANGWSRFGNKEFPLLFLFFSFFGKKERMSDAGIPQKRRGGG